MWDHDFNQIENFCNGNAFISKSTSYWVPTSSQILTSCWISPSVRKRMSLVSSSQNMQPMAQISIAVVQQVKPLRSSGALQYKVPTSLVIGAFLFHLTSLDMPKSIILRLISSASSRTIFAGLISRCIMQLLWMLCSALSISCIIFLTFIGISDLITLLRQSCFHSVIMLADLDFMCSQRGGRMQGLFNFFRIWISRTALTGKPSLPLFLNIFIATRPPVSVFFPFQTTPQVPSAIFSSLIYFLLKGSYSSDSSYDEFINIINYKKIPFQMVLRRTIELIISSRIPSQLWVFQQGSPRLSFMIATITAEQICYQLIGQLFNNEYCSLS